MSKLEIALEKTQKWLKKIGPDIAIQKAIKPALDQANKANVKVIELKTALLSAKMEAKDQAIALELALKTIKKTKKATQA